MDFTLGRTLLGGSFTDDVRDCMSLVIKEGVGMVIQHTDG